MTDDVRLTDEEREVLREKAGATAPGMCEDGHHSDVCDYVFEALCAVVLAERRWAVEVTNTRAQKLYDWLVTLPLDDPQRKKLSLRAGELFEMVKLLAAGPGGGK